MHVRDYRVHAREHDAGRPGGEHRALEIEPAHQHRGAAVFFAEQVCFRHLDVVEHQFAGIRAAHAELVEFLRRGETEVALDDKRGDAARSGVGIGLGVDDEDVGVGTVGDPHLGAVEQPAIGRALGLHRHADHVGTGPGLGHRERADVLAADEARQVFFALRVVAVAMDLVDAEVRVRAVGQPHRCRRAADFLHRDDVREVTHVAAAVLLGHGDAEQAHVAELRPQLVGKLVGAVDVGRARRDLGLGEFGDRVAQQVGGFAEIEVE